MRDWDDDCMEYRGTVLTGRYSHFCMDWDGLPIDETCIEWPCCGYEPEGITQAERATARAVNAAAQDEFEKACAVANITEDS